MVQICIYDIVDIFEVDIRDIPYLGGLRTRIIDKTPDMSLNMDMIVVKLLFPTIIIQCTKVFFNCILSYILPVL